MLVVLLGSILDTWFRDGSCSERDLTHILQESLRSCRRCHRFHASIATVVTATIGWADRTDASLFPCALPPSSRPPPVVTICVTVVIVTDVIAVIAIVAAARSSRRMGCGRWASRGHDGLQALEVLWS